MPTGTGKRYHLFLCLAIVLFLPLTLTQHLQAQESYLINPGLEKGGESTSLSSSVASDWYPWSVLGDEQQTRKVERKLEDICPTNNPYCTHDGRHSPEFFTTDATRTAGFYQRARVPKDSAVTFSIWGQVYTGPPGFAAKHDDSFWDDANLVVAAPPTRPSAPSTATPAPPTSTPLPPTSTPAPPISTPVPPTSTPVPPTSTLVPPTATLTPSAAPTPTETRAPTATPAPATATHTAIPSTATPSETTADTVVASPAATWTRTGIDTPTIGVATATLTQKSGATIESGSTQMLLLIAIVVLLLLVGLFNTRQQR